MEIQTWTGKYYFCYIFFIVNFIFLLLLYMQPIIIMRPSPEVTTNRTFAANKDYLIYTSKCWIPNVDPWNEEMKPFYKKEPYVSCTKHDLLTYVVKNDTKAFLHVNRKAAKQYGATPITCCSIEVIRNTSANVPDNDIEFSNCVDFKESLDITGKTVTVKCRTKYENIYNNTYAPVTIAKEIEDRMLAHSNKSSNRRLSVLIIGIDSISRLNFIRTMPKTRAFLANTSWIEYKGYNKIGDNTFPNLVAILTGKRSATAYDKCNPVKVGGLDSCEFIWEQYKRFGYVTAYGEDEYSINTFNYNKKGFVRNATDYYFRAYSVAVGKLNKKQVDEMHYCTGPESAGERILNLALDFARTFRNYPTFGFFWMNTFSHNKLNSPTRMDTKVSEFLDNLHKTGSFDNSAIIFLSDHGLRFGKVRSTYSGWLEERLPFLFVRLPEWFREKFPREYSNLARNGETQLTTPYDLHMTLQDVLILSGFDYKPKLTEGSTASKSFFQEIPTRSCEEVGIDKHWCTCYGYKNIEAENEIAAKAGEFLIEELNSRVSKFGNASRNCARYKMGKVIRAGILIDPQSKSDTYLLIVIQTVPEATFEITVTVTNGNITEGNYLSRLNRYGSSPCVRDSELKIYCKCK